MKVKAVVEDSTAVISGGTNEIRLNIYAAFIVRTAELKRDALDWMNWAKGNKN